MDNDEQVKTTIESTPDKQSTTVETTAPAPEPQPATTKVETDHAETSTTVERS